MKLRVGRDGSYVAVLSTTRQEPGKTRRIFQSFLELVMGGRQIMGRHRSLLFFFLCRNEYEPELDPENGTSQKRGLKRVRYNGIKIIWINKNHWMNSPLSDWNINKVVSSWLDANFNSQRWREKTVWNGTSRLTASQYRSLLSVMKCQAQKKTCYFYGSWFSATNFLTKQKIMTRVGVFLLPAFGQGATPVPVGTRYVFFFSWFDR